MTAYVLPIVFALFVWWFSTGAILYLDGLQPRTFKWTMSVFTLALSAALALLALSKNDQSVLGAYTAFSSSIVVWAWQETAFLLGYITGPQRSSCPPQLRGWSRARRAFGTVLHHEIALLTLALGVVAATWNGSNLIGLWTYLLLWGMRQSAKLNVFLGVRNLSEVFLPPHLAYLQTYFSRRSMNAFFPVSVTLMTALALLLWSLAARTTEVAQAVAYTFLATLVSLGVLEHLLMVLPFKPETLWRWALRKPQETTWKPAPIAK